MTIAEKLKNTKSPLFTFELLPPLKGHHIDELYAAIDPLVEFNPAYINITYHQEEVVFRKNTAGVLEKRKIRKRPGTAAISAALQNKYGITVIPHIICGGFSAEETEEALIDLSFLKINNLLALRGDPPKGKHIFKPVEGGHRHTNELVKQIMAMNNGKYLDDKYTGDFSTNFSVGVAGYPEKHFESPNMKSDINHLKMKVDAGADYIVTQMFFDNQKYFEFVELCRAAGITVPIVPGIKPINRKRDMRVLPQTFYIDIPQELVDEIDRCKTDAQARQAGVEWAVKQSKELKSFGVPALHYYTLGQSDNIRKIAGTVF
ncbi:MAG: methylenetetrahydrofolate reductase [NAD(P)H] [Bacteroidota bacterium]|nr:methylenetetrahydrofolate reductase [NAD(P)H] [Bacteroidota bacterium]